MAFVFGTFALRWGGSARRVPRLATVRRPAALGDGERRAAWPPLGGGRRTAAHASLAQSVKDRIASDDVVAFTTTSCPFCADLRELFDDLGVAFTEYDFNEMEDGMDVREELRHQTGQRSVPNVFIDRKHIGGFDAVSMLAQDGKLQAMLQKLGKK